MRICNGCGGIIGRDCYNTVECMDIARQLQNDRQYDEYMASRSLLQIIGDKLRWMWDSKFKVNKSDIPW
jgi:hypothetical protein